MGLLYRETPPVVSAQSSVTSIESVTALGTGTVTVSQIVDSDTEISELDIYRLSWEMEILELYVQATHDIDSLDSDCSHSISSVNSDASNLVEEFFA
jgi:hypothetical protein